MKNKILKQEKTQTLQEILNDITPELEATEDTPLKDVTAIIERLNNPNLSPNNLDDALFIFNLKKQLLIKEKKGESILDLQKKGKKLLRRKVRKLSLKLHPDKHLPSFTIEKNAALLKINYAKDFLLDFIDNVDNFLTLLHIPTTKDD